jgi:hypothetical protein
MTDIGEWGAVMRLARRAALLAGEEQRRLGRVSEQEDSSIMLYTDDPTTAGLFVLNSDMAAMCKTSGIGMVGLLPTLLMYLMTRVQRNLSRTTRTAALTNDFNHLKGLPNDQ